MKQQKISINDFHFIKKGYGIYKVTYQSPATLKIWVNELDDMSLIDNTKNRKEPKVKDLKQLKRHCKDGELMTEIKW